MRIGIFGGAFNPVHNGHIHLAQSYIETLKLDKLLVIPTANPPHRAADGFVSAPCRFDMLHLAFGSNDKIEISDIEFEREEKSYTYDTVQLIKSAYPDAELYLIIGQDQFLCFDKWYNYDKLLEDVVLCTAAREKDSKEKIIRFAENKLQGAEFILAGFEPVVVSSSEIRDKIKKGEDASELLPEKVLDYIINKGLYHAEV